MKNVIGSLFSIFLTSYGLSTTITFNEVADGTVLTTQYASSGATFSASEDGNSVNSIVLSTYGNGHRYWANSGDTSTTDRWDVLRIDFSSPADDVSFLVQTHGTLPPTFAAYSSTGSLLESFTSSGDWVSTGFSVDGISYILATQPSDGWLWGMDDLQFTIPALQTPTATVPDGGATFALLGLSLSGVAVIRRKLGRAER